MPLTVRLVGPEPLVEPCRPQEGRYLLKLEGAAKIRDVLPWFGLEEAGLSFFLNGSPAGLETSLGDEDALDIIQLVMGG